MSRGGPPRVSFGTKAETLERLAPLLRSARVLPQERFTVGAWRADPAAALGRLGARGWLDLPVIVRSSSREEDAPRGSQAGRFLSVAGCEGGEAVAAGIRAVVGSLEEGREAAARQDQVFVQPELRRPRLSGVALTRDPANASHYLVFAYDDASGRTGAITSGRAEERRTYYRHRDSPVPAAPELAAVAALCEELEELLGEEALDVELAVDAEGALVLLQVRPLALPERPAAARADEARALARIAERVAELGEPHPYVYGSRAVFGTMPDWNPAEVLGARPRPLAVSLYKDLVTDGIWAYQRSNYGYRNLRSFPLLLSFGGLPYVDVRVSFNSFLPAELDADLGRRLVDHYTARLLESPLDHDKVEFAIVHSCYTPDLEERLGPLAERGFTQDDRDRLAESLLRLTNRITAEPGLFRADLEKVAELEGRQAAFAEQAGELDLVARVFWLLEDCKRYGTLPFAGIARAAFIAVQMLDSLVSAGALSAEERGAFLRSLRTVRARMSEDLVRLARPAFLERYGHLRPGTYDVTSPRYDAEPGAYFEGADSSVPGDPSAVFELPRERMRRIDSLLASHGLAHDAENLLAFVRDAVEGREHAKFVFTRSLSDALELCVELAARHGFSREDLAHADVELLRRLYAGSEDPGELLGASIAEGRARFAVTRQLTLPPLLTEPEEAWAFHLPVCEPSFVTVGSAQGPVVTARPDPDGAGLRGGIVMIPSADPGYDWIFSHAVAGFVTMYGGYNSHMAIRANELGIPAVVGAGETLFRSWSAARGLRLDCLNRRVEVLR